MATTVRLSEDLEKKYINLYGTKTTGVQEAANSFLYLRANSLIEIKGIFTQNELKAIVDNFNGTMMQEQFMCNKNVLIAHLEDGEKYEGLSRKWDISLDDLIQKIKNLIAVQVYFLQSEINRFWNIPEAYGSPNLDKFINEYC